MLCFSVLYEVCTVAPCAAYQTKIPTGVLYCSPIVESALGLLFENVTYMVRAPGGTKLTHKTYRIIIKGIPPF